MLEVSEILYIGGTGFLALGGFGKWVVLRFDREVDSIRSAAGKQDTDNSATHKDLYDKIDRVKEDTIHRSDFESLRADLRALTARIDAFIAAVSKTKAD